MGKNEACPGAETILNAHASEASGSIGKDDLQSFICQLVRASEWFVILGFGGHEGRSTQRYLLISVRPEPAGKP